MDSSSVPLLDVIRSLAFVGDLAMGQPIDHSPRAAWMAGQLAKVSGADDATCTQATAVALLRWSGCTANAPEFAQLFGDDVSGRKALLAVQSSGSAFRSTTRRKGSGIPLVVAHPLRGVRRHRRAAGPRRGNAVRIASPL